jgi:nicotinate phosphoribosyltransferase
MATTCRRDAPRDGRRADGDTVTRVSGALITDLYELNMAASFLRRSMNKLATFSLFMRQLPANRGFLVAAGLESALEGLEQYSFDDEDLEYVGKLGFDNAVLQTFARMRFSGQVWAVPEGRIVLANEPLLEVTAPIAEAQLVETILLNQLTFQTALATKAARCRLAADGKMDLVEFGFRRTQVTDRAANETISWPAAASSLTSNATTLSGRS